MRQKDGENNNMEFYDTAGDEIAKIDMIGMYSANGEGGKCIK
jgi:hypothetical protein